MKSDYSLPWKALQTKSPYGSWGVFTVQDCYSVLDGSAPGVDSKVNAELIVRAVNNHQALIDALIRAREGLMCRVVSRIEPRQDCECWSCETARQIDAALASIDPIPTPAVSNNLHQPLNS